MNAADTHPLGDPDFTIVRGLYRHGAGFTCDTRDPAWFAFAGAAWRTDLPAAYMDAAGAEGWPAIRDWLLAATPATWSPPTRAELAEWVPAGERSFRAGAGIYSLTLDVGPDVLALRVALPTLPATDPARAIAAACLQNWIAQCRMVRSATPGAALPALEVSLTGAPAPLEPLLRAAAAALRIAASAIIPALESLREIADAEALTVMNGVASWWSDGGENSNKKRRRK